MIYFLFLVIFCFISFICSTYYFLSLKEKVIKKMQKAISISLDIRFKNFELLIQKVSEIMDYEQTVLKEIVQLRSKAQKHKQEGDIRAEFFCEEKISQIALKIDIVFEEFPQLKRIENLNELKEKILSSEDSLLQLKNKYNSLVVRYNKAKSSIINVPVTNLFEKFDEKIELWKISN